MYLPYLLINLHVKAATRGKTSQNFGGWEEYMYNRGMRRRSLADHPKLLPLKNIS